MKKSNLVFDDFPHTLMEGIMQSKISVIPMIIMSIFLFTGCGKSLSKDTASEKIKQNLSPITQAAQVQIDAWGKPMCNECYICGVENAKRTDEKQIFNALAQGGYITSLKIGNPLGGWGWFAIQFQLTEKIKPYIIVDKRNIKIKIGEVESVIIVAMSEPADFMGKKVREVTYSAKYKPTISGALPKGRTEKNGKAIFALYDSGWELEK